MATLLAVARPPRTGKPATIGENLYLDRLGRWSAITAYGNGEPGWSRWLTRTRPASWLQENGPAAALAAHFPGQRDAARARAGAKVWNLRLAPVAAACYIGPGLQAGAPAEENHR
jgi:hypothetical protein